MKYSRFSIKNVVRSLAVVAASLVAFSCSSMPETVPDDAREIVQLAQDAADSGKSGLAKWYYVQLIQKYPEDLKIYVEGNFEIAHIDIKKKRYEAAVPRLNEILNLYADLAPGRIPGQYKKLAENDLAKVPEDVLAKINARLNAKDTDGEEEFTTVNDMPENYPSESDFE